MEYLPEWVSVDKVRYTLMKLEKLKALKREGIGKGTKYYVVSIPENVEFKFPHKTLDFPHKLINEMKKDPVK